MGTRWRLSRRGCILGWDPAPWNLTLAVVLQGRGRRRTVHGAGERWQGKEEGAPSIDLLRNREGVMRRRRRGEVKWRPWEESWGSGWMRWL